MTGKDNLGRFTKGNTYASLGFQGLVSKRFNGSYSLAREWLRAIGKYGYGKSFYSESTGYPHWVKECFRVYPGTPETFSSEFAKKLDFKLSDCKELSF